MKWLILTIAMLCIGITLSLLVKPVRGRLLNWMILHNLGVIKSVSVCGDSLVTESQVRDAAQVVPGMHLFGFSSPEVVRRIEKLSWVASATVNRGMAGGVVINVVERRPVAFVNLGGIFFTDTAGFLWQLQERGYRPLPLLSGLRDSITSETTRVLNWRSRDRMLKFLDGIKIIQQDTANTVSQAEFMPDGVVRIKFLRREYTVDLHEGLLKTGIDHLSALQIKMRNWESVSPRHIDCSYENVAYLQ